MRYLLIDRIIECKTSESIQGIKNVALSEDFLEHHFPKNPIMPGVLLLEALTQLAGWLEASSSDFQNWFLLERVERCMFYGFAFPGDTVELELRRQSQTDPSVKAFSGLCSVNGRKKMGAEFCGSTIALAEIEDVEEQRRLFRFLTRAEATR
jgi:3-hydroxyacyl-[acyl-carrier-protein] dehydratase